VTGTSPNCLIYNDKKRRSRHVPLLYVVKMKEYRSPAKSITENSDAASERCVKSRS
jgi:hypothetical protein